jgi:hypothetical protein
MVLWVEDSAQVGFLAAGFVDPPFPGRTGILTAHKNPGS